MFEQTFLDIPEQNKGRRRWMVVASYLLQALAVIAALAFPLLHTEALPIDDHPTVHPPTRYVPPHVQVVPAPASLRPRPSKTVFTEFRQPSRIPQTIDRTPEPPAPNLPSAELNQSTEGAIPVGDPRQQNAVLASVLHRPTLAAHPTVVPRTAKAEESLLLRQVKPVYPALAVQTRTQGSVLLRAVISKEGAIQHLEVVAGHPLLVTAAVQAVKQWHYRPFLLDGEPVEVETQITVNFTLNGQ